MFSILLLSIGLLFALRYPTVQTYISQKIAHYLSEELGTEISVKNVYFKPFRSLEIQQFTIHDRQGNTLVAAKRAEASISLTAIWDNKINIQKLLLEDASVHYEIYADSSNASFLIDYFNPQKKQKKSASKSLQFELQNLSLHNNRFSLINHRYNHHHHGVDFSDLDLYEISGDFREIHYTDSSMQAQIEGFTFKEKSGLYLKNFTAASSVSNKKMEFTKMHMQTNYSKAADYLIFRYKDFSDFHDFINKVYLDGHVKNSFIDSRDIAFFAPEMRDVRFTSDIIEARVSGTVSALQAKNVFLKTGKETRLRGHFRIDGLPFIERTLFDFQLSQLQTSAADLENFIPDLINGPFQLPQQLQLLETVNYEGRIQGYYHQFTLQGLAQTALGTLSSNSEISLKPDLHYQGTVESEDFHIGTLLANQELGELGFNVEFEGTGNQQKPIQLTANGGLYKLRYKQHTFQAFNFNSALQDNIFQIQGNLEDPDAKLSFEGNINWQDSVPNYSVHSEIAHLDLKKLQLFEEDHILIKDANLQAKLYGNSLNTLNGQITSDQLQFESSQGAFQIDYIDLKSEGDAQSKKLILNSAIADGVMSGEIDLPTIGNYFRSLAMRYAPAINIETRPYHAQNFDLDLKIKSFAPIAVLFDPKIGLDAGAQLRANFSSKNYTANFEAHAAKVSYHGIKMTNLQLNENADDQAFSLDIMADRLNFSDSTYIDNIVINNILAEDKLIFGIALSELNRPNHLVLGGNIHFAPGQPAYIRFDQSEIVLNNESWIIGSHADLRLSKGKLHINKLHIARDQQDILLNGILSNDQQDQLDIHFDNFNLATISGITRPLGIDLIGHLQGDVHIFSAFQSPKLSTHISTSPILYNNLPIGRLSFDADFDPQTGLMTLNSELRNQQGGGFTLAGTYDMQAPEDALQLKGTINNLDLGIAQPFLRSLVSDLYGRISGAVQLHGTLSHPLINGATHIKEAAFLVNYLQTRYQVNEQHSLIQNNQIILHNFIVNDAAQASAQANGFINLQKMNDPTLSVDLTTDNFQILNTKRKDNELFFGTAYASGQFRFHGPTSAMAIAIQARTNPNTTITIPFNSSLTVSENDFIYFVDPETSNSTLKPTKRSFQGLILNMDISITPDASINLENNIGSLTGIGTGDISLRISSLGDFEMFGDYLVNSGKFHFTAQDFFNKFFDLKEGGTIRWAGNPSEASINLGATYQQRTSIAPLYNAAGRAENNDRVLAQADMILQGTLSQPEVSFDLNFPQTPYVKDELQGYLSDGNNVNQQAISLIIRRSFTPASTQEFGKEVNNTLLSAGTEIAFNQLNSIISQSLNMNFLDLNIRSFNDASASLRFFDDRLVLTGGVSDRSKSQLNDLSVFSDQVATDAEVTFKLRKDGNLVLRAYNRLNTRNFLFTPYSDYISAAGLVYRQEFNSLTEFWKKLWIWNEPKKRDD